MVFQGDCWQCSCNGNIASCKPKAFPSRLQTSNLGIVSLPVYSLNFLFSQSFKTGLSWTKIGNDTVTVLWQRNGAALQITCWGMTIRMACTLAKLPECSLSVHQSVCMSRNNQVPGGAFSLIWSIEAWTCLILGVAHHLTCFTEHRQTSLF